MAIQSVDMAAADTDGAARTKAKSVSDISRVVVNSGWATKGKFVPGDLKNTNVGWGVVHLYREGQETPGLYDDASDTGSDRDEARGEKLAFNEEDCRTLCILAVPSYMTPSDFLGWVGEQTREEVSNFRLIRTGSANKYMVLMKFRDAKKARQWRKDWDGKLFNSMEVRTLRVSPMMFDFLLSSAAARELPGRFCQVDPLYSERAGSFQLPGQHQRSLHSCVRSASHCTPTNSLITRRQSLNPPRTELETAATSNAKSCGTSNLSGMPRAYGRDDRSACHHVPTCVPLCVSR